MKSKFKAYWKETLALLSVLMILALIFNSSSCNALKSLTKEKGFNKKIDMKSSNYVYNITDRKFLDTIIITGLNYLKIKDTKVLIKNIPKNVSKEQDYDELQAFIFNKNEYYIIYIKNTSRSESIDILAHELVHYKQYYDGRLVYVNGESIIWKGKTYKLANTNYDKRPWEVEAFDSVHELAHILREKLYE